MSDLETDTEQQEKSPSLTTAQQHTVNMERARILALIPFGIALNIGLGTLVTALKIPLYLDAIATVAITLLAGFRAGATVGVATNLVGVLVNPVLPWYCGTQFLLAAYTALVAKQGWLATKSGEDSRLPRWVLFARIIVVGIGLGFVSAFASAPVSTYLFSGITGSGPSVVVALLLKSGKSVISSVLTTAMFFDTLDKIISLFLAIGLIRALPPSLKLAFGGGYLKQNRLAN